MKDRYDVVIIGAGIGGLVCGCYLAKAGLKVLIVEKHDKPGGYCTSFKRKGYIFDVGPHYLGSLREEGVLFKILKELELLERIKFITNDPTDRIITPDKTIFIRKNKEDTKKELISHFPEEKDNIERFFKFILHKDFLYIVSKTKKITFKQLLDQFFRNHKLKAILSVLTINLNLPPSKASALVMVVLFREFIFDGGYYPEGGMQVFSDLLAERFKEYGGQIRLSIPAQKILTKGDRVEAVELGNGEVISSRVVVSNADATLTFKELLDCPAPEAKKVDKLRPSHSAYEVFLGLKKKLKINPPHFVTWLLSGYDVEGIYKEMGLFENMEIKGGVVVLPSLVDSSLAPRGKDSLRVLILAQYASGNVWKIHRDKMFNRVIEKIESLIPGVRDVIEIKEVATPYTFYKYTYNREGALFGWQVVPEQIDKNIFPPHTGIKNLYLVGHWTTSGAGVSGISMVSFCGREISKIIKRSSI